MNIEDRNWAYLLRVGADSGKYGGGFHSPIFNNGTFEFIPIPEPPEDQQWLREVGYGRFTYCHTYHRSAKHSFADYIADEQTKRSLFNKCMHVDPDFANATYGDIAITKKGKCVPKAATLRKLEPGHLLVFCAKLDPFGKNNTHESGVYIVGYFEVKKVHSFKEKKPTERWEICKEFREKNPHCAVLTRSEMKKYYVEGLVLVEGKGSTLLKTALRLTDENDRVMPRWKRELGLNATQFPRGGRWLPQKNRNNKRKREQYILRLKKILRENGKCSQKLKTIANVESG